MPERARAGLSRWAADSAAAWRAGGLKGRSPSGDPERERPEGAGLAHRIGRPGWGSDWAGQSSAEWAWPSRCGLGAGPPGRRGRAAGGEAAGPGPGAARCTPGGEPRRQAGLCRGLTRALSPLAPPALDPRPPEPPELCPRMSDRPEPACAVGRPRTRSWWVPGPLGGGRGAPLPPQDPSSRCSSFLRI